MVRTAGLEPARSFDREIFLPATVFTAGPVCRLGPGRSLHHHHAVALGAARLASTPSDPLSGLGLARDWHGSMTVSVPRI